MRHSRKPLGFTLIELIVVIVLAGIIAGFIAQNISRPILGFIDTTRRAALVDAGDTAITRMVREARLALPNSIRISGGVALEFLRTRTGGRYRARIDPGMASDELDFTTTDTSFDVLGTLKNFGQICAGTSPSCGGGAASTAACMASAAVDCLVIYNTGQPADCSLLAAGRTNAYCGDNVAGVDVADVAGGTLSFVIDTTQFPLPSPNQRFHIIDTPVTYLCDTANRRLLRYDGYAIGPLQPTLAAPPATAARVVAENVVGCSFGYDPGSASRAALLSVRLRLADADASSEQITLFEQAHVPNTP
ncbi:MAG: type II secretion system protein [Gammaproteobacteria bacterium]